MADPRGPSSRIEIKSVPARQTASVRETVGQADTTEALGRMYQAVRQALEKQGIEPTGAPFARYHEFGAKNDLEAGMPVSRPISADGDVKPSELPGGLAAIAIHAGPYEGLHTTYAAITEWMASTGRTASGGPWELYLTDPSTEPDPAKWLTQVVWPLRQT